MNKDDFDILSNMKFRVGDDSVDMFKRTIDIYLQDKEHGTLYFWSKNELGQIVRKQDGYPDVIVAEDQVKNFEYAIDFNF